MIQRIELLNDWYFQYQYQDGMEYSRDVKGYAKVQLPHTNAELPFHYFDEKAFQVTSCYKHYFESPVLGKNQVALLRFEGVMSYAKVYLNGSLLGDHKGGYTPFSFPVQDLLSAGGQNEITVIADASEREDIPPFGGQIDYLTYGGIYREVSLDIFEPVHIENAKIEPLHALESEKGLRIKALIGNQTAETPAVLAVRVTDGAGNTVFLGEKAVLCPAGRSSVECVFESIEKDSHAEPIRLWTLDDPALYTVQLILHAGDREDLFESRTGFRTAEFKPEGFFLNGERVRIMGLNRHQSWPYVGYAMPRRAQEKDADILKFDLHLNLTRTSHYPQSIHFLNRCDEIGLLVFEEIPGWQHIGEDTWKDVACENVRDMIERDWNHPSIIMWGVRINESRDDHDFYVETNRIARSLDTTRAIGGVRCIENSELLEDVYTMNDFTDDGDSLRLRGTRDVTGLDRDVPYLITEFCGHMYPTKKFDCEERQIGLVSRHLRIHHEASADPLISGAIGWCAFDYNTHKDFGSGDHVCYHGVMDMFRTKKFAAYVYKSQVSPQVEPVLMPVTYWARGERSIGGILPLILLTNCDTITVQFGNYEPIPVTGRADEFGSLPYPPFVIKMSDIGENKLGEWGMLWEDGIIRGYVDGKLAAEKHFSQNPVPSGLIVVPDDTRLTAGCKDVTRFQITVVDQKSNTLPFADNIIRVTLQGPARLQGPNIFALKGGSFGFYVETCGEPGIVKVLVESDGFPPQEFEIEVC